MGHPFCCSYCFPPDCWVLNGGCHSHVKPCSLYRWWGHAESLPSMGENTCLCCSITLRRLYCRQRALGTVQGAVQSSPGDDWDKRCSPRLAYALQPHITGEGVAHPIPHPSPHAVHAIFCLGGGKTVAHISTMHDIISQRQGPLMSFCWLRPQDRTWCS